MNLIAASKRVHALPGAEVPDLRGQRAARTPRTSHPTGAFRVKSSLPDTAHSRPKSAATALTRPVWPPRREGGTPDPESASRARGPGRGREGKVSSKNLLKINQGTYKEGSQQ